MKGKQGAKNEIPKKRRFTVYQKVNLVWNILWLAFYCFYCIYFIVNGLGSRVMNYILLGATAAYFLLFVAIWVTLGRKGKRFTGAGKRIYKVIRKLLLFVNTVLAGGAIINVGAMNSKMIVAVCAFIAVGNIVLNVVWLILRHVLEKRFGESIGSLKAEAKQFLGGVKSLFKKGFEKDGKADTDPALESCGNRQEENIAGEDAEQA